MSDQEQIAEIKATIETLRLVGYSDAADKMERLLTEGKLARAIICDWYEMWECSNDPKEGLIESTEQYLALVSDRRNRVASSTARASGCGPEDGGSIPLPPSTTSDSPKDMCDEPGCSHAANCTIHKMGTQVCNCGVAASECNHFWHSNSGRGGEPVFRRNRSREPLMHVRCSECNTLTWLTEQQWKDSSHTTAAYDGKKNWPLDGSDYPDFTSERDYFRQLTSVYAELMTKAEIIYRRQEAIRMRCAMLLFAAGRQIGKQAMTELFYGTIICDEASEITPEMWDRWATIDRHQLLSEARRAEKGRHE